MTTYSCDIPAKDEKDAIEKFKIGNPNSSIKITDAVILKVKERGNFRGEKMFTVTFKSKKRLD